MTEVMDRTTLKALSTNTRQEILKYLAKRPYTASELSKILGRHVTTISEHLSVLERSGIVHRKDSTNKWIYYTLTDKGQKFFKPYYTWVIALCVSIVAFVFGLYEIFFIRLGESVYTVKSEMLAAGSVAVVETPVVYSTNVIIGAALVATGFAFLLFAVKKYMQKRHIIRSLEMMGSEKIL